MRDKFIGLFILLLFGIIAHLSQEQWWPYVTRLWDSLNDHSKQIGLLDGLFAIVGTIVAVLVGYFTLFGRSNDADSSPEGEGNRNGSATPVASVPPVNVNIRLDVDDVTSRVRQVTAPNPQNALPLRPEPKDVAKARARYLDLLAQRCNVLPLAALGGQGVWARR